MDTEVHVAADGTACVCPQAGFVGEHDGQPVGSRLGFGELFEAVDVVDVVAAGEVVGGVVADPELFSVGVGAGPPGCGVFEFDEGPAG